MTYPECEPRVTLFNTDKYLTLVVHTVHTVLSQADSDRTSFCQNAQKTSGSLARDVDTSETNEFAYTGNLKTLNF